MTPEALNESLYRRCQQMAARAAQAEYAAARRARRIRPGQGMFCAAAAVWVNLFECYRKGQVTEETLKGNLMVGHVYDDSPAWDGIPPSYRIPSSTLKRKLR
jgi:hypothetical protein